MAIFEYRCVKVHSCEDIYEPSEDTFLLMDSVSGVRDKKCLEVGTGSGMVACLLAKSGNVVTATDIEKDAVSCARKNAKLNGVAVKFKQADMFEGIKGKFDVILFNPPYLPTEEEDRVKGPLNKALDGGADGLAVTRQFLRTAPQFLAPDGEIFVIISSLSPPDAIERVLSGFEHEVVGRCKHFFEEIRCYRLNTWEGT